MPLNSDPPTGWPVPHRSAVRVLAAVFLGLISGLIAVVSVAAAVTGDAMESIGFGLAAILGGHITAIGITDNSSDFPTIRSADSWKTSRKSAVEKPVEAWQQKSA